MSPSSPVARVPSATSRLGRAFELIVPSQLRIAREACPPCGGGWQVRLAINEMAVRCLRCGASAVTQSLVEVLGRTVPALDSLDVYELSGAGPLVSYLQPRCRSLTLSEYVEGATPGDIRDGVSCQNVERLTFPAECFDLCTSTEVFEHVEDDRAGFGEIHRVLRPGGCFVFTVPIDLRRDTIERTAVRDGRRVDLLPPEYHADRYRGAKVLCHRDYGQDVLARLRSAGFSDARIATPQRRLFGLARPVIVALKAT